LKESQQSQAGPKFNQPVIETDASPTRSAQPHRIHLGVNSKRQPLPGIAYGQYGELVLLYFLGILLNGSNGRLVQLQALSEV
jgi:hypothetical protein